MEAQLNQTAQKFHFPLEKVQHQSDDVSKKRSLKCKITMQGCKLAVNTHLPQCESAVS